MAQRYNADILIGLLKKELARYEGGATRQDFEFLQNISQSISYIPRLTSKSDDALILDLITLLAETGRRNLDIGRIIMSTLINILESEDESGS